MLLLVYTNPHSRRSTVAVERSDKRANAFRGGDVDLAGRNAGSLQCYRDTALVRVVALHNRSGECGAIYRHTTGESGHRLHRPVNGGLVALLFSGGGGYK